MIKIQIHKKNAVQFAFLFVIIKVNNCFIIYNQKKIKEMKKS
jgi:hypothetical protein